MPSDPKRLLLDTSVVLHIARANKVAQRMDAAYGLRSRLDRPLISIVTVGESMAFAAKRNWGEPKRAKLRALLAELVVVEIRSGTVVERYAEIDAWAESHGVAIGKNDLWIAATAMAADATVLSNDRDFTYVEGAGVRAIYFDPDSVATT